MEGLDTILVFLVLEQGTNLGKGECVCSCTTQDHILRHHINHTPLNPALSYHVVPSMMVYRTNIQATISYIIIDDITLLSLNK